MAGFATDIGVDVDLEAAINAISENMYKVIVINDDVTTFETVITALVNLFDHTPEEADALAWQVHRNGSAVVGLLPKEEAIQKTEALHGYKIQASYEKA